MNYYKRSGKDNAIEFTNNFLVVVIIISGILSLLGIIFAPEIVSFISPNLDNATFELTVILLKVLFPIMIFTAVAFVFVGFLQSLDEFNIPAIISVVANAIVILYLITLNNKYGIKGAAVAMIIAWSTQVLVQLPSIIKKGYKKKFKLNIKNEGIKKVAKLALPILVSTWVLPINNLVNLRLASGLENGQAISAIEYSYNLFLIIVGVFSYTLSNIIFPELSKKMSDNDEENTKQILINSIDVSMYFIIPMSVGIGLLSEEIIKLIYERGEFNAYSTMLTGNALMFYSFGMLGYGITEILNKVFYAMKNVKVPMKLGFLSIILNIVLSIILVKTMGYKGLPLAYSISTTIVAFIMLYIVNRKVKGILSNDTYIDLIKIIVSATIMGIFIMLIKKLVTSTILTILLSVSFGVVIYFIITIVAKVNVIDKFLKRNLKKDE